MQRGGILGCLNVSVPGFHAGSPTVGSQMETPGSGTRLLCVHLCVHIKILLTNVCTWTHRHPACTGSRTHEHTGLWMAMSGPIHEGHGTPELHQGLAVPKGHVAAQPLPGWGLVPPLLLSNSNKFRPSPGTHHTEESGSTAGPSHQPGSGSLRDFPKGKACPQASARGPCHPLVSRVSSLGRHPVPHVPSLRIPWVCVSSPEHFISLTHSQMPSPCPVTMS